MRPTFAGTYKAQLFPFYPSPVECDPPKTIRSTEMLLFQLKDGKTVEILEEYHETVMRGQNWMESGVIRLRKHRKILQCSMGFASPRLGDSPARGALFAQGPSKWVVSTEIRVQHRISLDFHPNRARMLSAVHTHFGCACEIGNSFKFAC